MILWVLRAKGIQLQETFKIQVLCTAIFYFFLLVHLDQDGNDRYYACLQTCFLGLTKLESFIQLYEWKVYYVVAYGIVMKSSNLISLFIYLFTCLFVYLFVYYLFIYLFIYLQIFYYHNGSPSELVGVCFSRGHYKTLH